MDVSDVKIINNLTGEDCAEENLQPLFDLIRRLKSTKCDLTIYLSRKEANHLADRLELMEFFK